MSIWSLLCDCLFAFGFWVYCIGSVLDVGFDVGGVGFGLVTMVCLCLAGNVLLLC